MTTTQTSLTDRELLELAAKAANLRIKWDDQNQTYATCNTHGDMFDDWNPLTDDADALRLAVELRIIVEIGEVITGVHAGHLKYISYAMHNGDPFAATRRAIVEAAAEIGKTNASYRAGRG